MNSDSTNRLPKDCPICEKSFDKSQSLYGHLQSHGLKKGKYAFDCKICKLQFTRTKFDSPTDFRIGWWWLESHCLPKNDERDTRIKNGVSFILFGNSNCRPASMFYTYFDYIFISKTL